MGLLTLIPAQVWQAAIDSDGAVRDGAWVTELTGLLDLTAWPPGMRVIVRKERPHPGAQLRLTDIDGLRVTAFATNTARGQLADLELRHRRRARCEDRIRNAKDTGLTNLPLHDLNRGSGWRNRDGSAVPTAAVVRGGGAETQSATYGARPFS